MIYLKLIELTNFKGVSNLSCEFDDLTLLAGLNNSGKTTLLQGIYLLFSAFPHVAEHTQLMHPNLSARRLSLHTALSPLGLRDTKWLSLSSTTDLEGKIVGTFANGVRLELGIIRNTLADFAFTVSHPDVTGDPEEIRPFLAPYVQVAAAMLTPPGDVPSREVMLYGDDFQNRLREGQGAQLWRNGIWWAIQTDGFERFAPVQRQIKKYFPEVNLLLPTLGATGTPEILIKYEERDRGPFDIAQSGAGLRTFISISRILEQSPAKVVLLDEPDSHLHASQQSAIVDLMLDVASSNERQVIIASHSPEVIRRVPPECLRWVDRGCPIAKGGYELSRVMEHLGVSAESYIPRSSLPDILVYVEGVDDRPIIEALINWCRQRSTIPLPTTLVVPHRDGRFQGPSLQSIVRVARELKSTVTVVGVRDLDWYYHELPSSDPTVESGDSWIMVTLPCKELENLFCDPSFLNRVYGEAIPESDLVRIVDEESNCDELVSEWCYQVRPRIRERLSNSIDLSTKERTAEQTFLSWKNDAEKRRRLVAGKGLLRKVRHRIRQIYNKSFYPNRGFEKIETLTPDLYRIATSVFPQFDQANAAIIPLHSGSLKE